MPRAEPSAPSTAAVASVFGSSDTDHDETAGAPAAAAAAVPMMMRPQQRLSAGSGEVAAWLMSHGLDAYTAPLIEAGYTPLVLFGLLFFGASYRKLPGTLDLVGLVLLLPAVGTNFFHSDKLARAAITDDFDTAPSKGYAGLQKAFFY